MGFTIMQAGKNFKSNRLERIFERSISIMKYFAKHMRNWGWTNPWLSVRNYSQMYSCDKGLQGNRDKGFSKYRRVFRYVGWNKRVTGMNICSTSVCSYPSGFIGGKELQKRWAHRVSEIYRRVSSGSSVETGDHLYRVALRENMVTRS